MTRDHVHCLRSYPVKDRSRLGLFAFVPLRRAPAKPVSDAFGRESRTQTDRLRVLVVEHEPLLRGMIVAMLFRQGWMVLGAADGEKALEVAESFRPHVTVAEWTLPGSLTGREVAEHLRVLQPQMATVFLTGLPVEALYPRVRPVAPCVLVEGPWEWGELAWAVRRVAGVRRNIVRRL